MTGRMTGFAMAMTAFLEASDLYDLSRVSRGDRATLRQLQALCNKTASYVEETRGPPSWAKRACLVTDPLFVKAGLPLSMIARGQLSKIPLPYPRWMDDFRTWNHRRKTHAFLSNLEAACPPRTMVTFTVSSNEDRFRTMFQPHVSVRIDRGVFKEAQTVVRVMCANKTDCLHFAGFPQQADSGKYPWKQHNYQEIDTTKGYSPFHSLLYDALEYYPGLSLKMMYFDTIAYEPPKVDDYLVLGALAMAFFPAASLQARSIQIVQNRIPSIRDYPPGALLEDVPTHEWNTRRKVAGHAWGLTVGLASTLWTYVTGTKGASA
jgi:hypothetical protein